MILLVLLMAGYVVRRGLGTVHGGESRIQTGVCDIRNASQVRRSSALSWWRLLSAVSLAAVYHVSFRGELLLQT